MADDAVWLTMALDGGRTLVTIMASGDILLADDMTPAEARQAIAMVSQHIRERKAEEDRLRSEVARLGG